MCCLNQKFWTDSPGTESILHIFLLSFTKKQESFVRIKNCEVSHYSSGPLVPLESWGHWHQASSVPTHRSPLIWVEGPPSCAPSVPQGLGTWALQKCTGLIGKRQRVRPRHQTVAGGRIMYWNKIFICFFAHLNCKQVSRLYSPFFLTELSYCGVLRAPATHHHSLQTSLQTEVTSGREIQPDSIRHMAFPLWSFLFSAVWCTTVTAGTAVLILWLWGNLD
jgi:hypothetical protein